MKVTKEKRYGTNEFLQNPVIFVQTKTRNYGPTSVEKKDYPDSLRLLPQERNKGHFHEQHIRRLHISKRTLYQVFLSKSELLEACVSFQIEKSRKQIEEKCRTLNCLEAIVYLNYQTYALSGILSADFCREIVKYPEALALFSREYREPLHEKCASLFREAQQKKLIQPESNFELAFMFFENTLLYALFAPYEEPKRALTYSNAVLTYLAGVCTAEGRKELHGMAVSGELQPAG